MGGFVVKRDDPRAADVQALLADHLAFARQHTPPEDVQAPDLAGLTAANASLFSVRQDGELLGVGALQQLDEFHEKSMHTAEAARGRGVGRALVDHLVGIAGARGFPGESRGRVDGSLRPGEGPLPTGWIRNLRALSPSSKPVRIACA